MTTIERANGCPGFEGRNGIGLNLGRAPASLDEALSRTLEAFSVGLAPSVRRIFSIWPNLWPVGMDLAEVQRVLAALLATAGEAMPEGGVLRVLAYNVRIQPEDLMLRGVWVLSRAKYVVVSVKDSGIGLPAAIQTVLLTPGDGGTAPATGACARLVQVRDMLLRHGGGFTIESSPVKGTRFNAYLPTTG